MKQQLFDLLRQCTVRVSVKGKLGHGTGFFVAQGLILSCAHIIKDAQSNTTPIEVYWQKHSYPAQIVECHKQVDLLLLRMSVVDHPCVYLHQEVKLRDQLISYGYPDTYPEGDTITCECEGWTEDSQPLLKFKLTQVRPGMSGSPLFNERTGSVCGLVKRSSDRDALSGGRAIPISMMFQTFPEVAARHQHFHEYDQRWGQLSKHYAIDKQKALSSIDVHTVTKGGIVAGSIGTLNQYNYTSPSVDAE